MKIGITTRGEAREQDYRTFGVSFDEWAVSRSWWPAVSRWVNPEGPSAIVVWDREVVRFRVTGLRTTRTDEIGTSIRVSLHGEAEPGVEFRSLEWLTVKWCEALEGEGKGPRSGQRRRESWPEIEVVLDGCLGAQEVEALYAGEEPSLFLASVQQRLTGAAKGQVVASPGERRESGARVAGLTLDHIAGLRLPSSNNHAAGILVLMAHVATVADCEPGVAALHAAGISVIDILSMSGDASRSGWTDVGAKVDSSPKALGGTQPARAIPRQAGVTRQQAARGFAALVVLLAMAWVVRRLLGG